jgi:putative acetyltransferase
MHIRKIKPTDNPFIEQIIKSSLVEFGLPMIGTAYEDKDTQFMHEAYQDSREIYFVLEDNGVAVGGGGIKALQNNNGNVCELQKMYFAPEARGKGYGKVMFDKCIDAAKKFGYTQCYLESAGSLEAAIHIYEKNGFKHLDGPLGGTGHYSCGVWMIKDLDTNQSDGEAGFTNSH